MCGCHESRNFIDHNSTFFSTAFIFFLLIGWTQDGMPHISLWLSACWCDDFFCLRHSFISCFHISTGRMP